MSILFAFLPTALAGASTNPSIPKAVTTFATAAETRDVTAIARVLDPSAVQHVWMNGTWSSLPTATYLDLMGKGVIGGDPVKVEITSLAHEGPVAMVSAVRTTPTLRFEDSLTLVEREGSWWIVAAAVVVSPVTK